MESGGRTVEDADGAQLLHGLVVAGAVDLNAPPAPAGRFPDFGVVVAPSGPLPEGDLPGELVASLDIPGTSYAATLEGSRLRVRFHETADFDVDLDSGAIVAAPVPGREGMVPVLLGGSVLALILGLAGEPVLHASAVTAGGSAIAIAGPSGIGKSTLAVLLCSLGMRLLTDDTARMTATDGSWAIHRGSAEVRLRGPAAGLAAQSGLDTAETADRRASARPALADVEVASLGAVLIPAWSDEIDRPDALPLSERAALAALLRAQRVAGWLTPEPLRSNFDCCAEIARSVQCFRLRAPRGRLDDPALAGQISAALAEAAGPEPA